MPSIKTIADALVAIEAMRADDGTLPPRRARQAVCFKRRLRVLLGWNVPAACRYAVMARLCYTDKDAVVVHSTHPTEEEATEVSDQLNTHGPIAWVERL